MNRNRLPTLSIRRWLALALVALFLAPLLTMATIGIILFRDQDGPWDPTSNVITELRANTGSWSDPAWQSSLMADHAGDTVDIILTVGDTVVFQSTDDPLADDPSRLVERVTIQDGDDTQTALVYSTPREGPPEELRQWFIPVALIAVLVATFTGIAWFLRRSIVVPLTATSDAAQRIAQGELEISLPSSRVREVARLGESFETMSTELRRSLDQQARLEEERRHFIAAIAHDLRTPLFSLRGSLEGLRSGIATTPERQRHYLDIAAARADHLEQLVADLFAYTRMEYLGEKPTRSRFDIGPFLEEVVDGVRSRADAHGIRLELALPQTSPVIDADMHLLTRAIGNIMDNALRFTPEQGVIEISVREQRGMVEVDVSDSGPGFAEDDLAHVVEPLYRGDASRNRQTGGAGLGLTIAHRIITAHGGALTVRNRASGGAQITLTIPSAGASPREGHT